MRNHEEGESGVAFQSRLGRFLLFFTTPFPFPASETTYTLVFLTFVISIKFFPSFLLIYPSSRYTVLWFLDGY